jgi:hypothetical protein
MLKKLLIGFSLTLGFAACASTPPAHTGAGAPRADKAVPPAGCVASTATRLPVNPRDCAGFGNAYTLKDIKSTGYTQVNQALSTLDPSVTTNGGH